MSYSEDHASALADVQAAGAAVTFTKGATTTCPGYAIGLQDDLRRYEELKLTETTRRTLLFVPTTYGDEPASGSTCDWGGHRYVLRDLAPFAPNGSMILARPVIVR